MKKFMSIAIAFLLALSVVPAMAADQTDSTRESTTSQAVDKVPATFQAFSNLAATERETLTPLTDKELEAIEGSFLDDICVACLNIAIVVQTNALVQTAASVFGDAVNAASQSNYSSIYQNNQ
jgi:putative cell wall-binding protein